MLRFQKKIYAGIIFRDSYTDSGIKKYLPSPLKIDDKWAHKKLVELL